MRIWKRKEQGSSGTRGGTVDETLGMYVYASPVEPYEIARSIVGASVVVRKTEQSINWNSILIAVVFLVVIPYFWVRALVNKVERSNAAASARATRMVQIKQGTLSPAINTPMNDANLFMTPGAVQNVASTAFYATLQSGYTATPTATLTAIQAISTATPTSTALYSVNVVFRYSYYNPKLGGVNCFDWDYATADCRSMMADGTDWRTEYGKAVACAPDIALGTVVEVTYPDALRGVWVCRDRGGAITGDLIDFLDIRQRADWLSPVSAVLYPPSTPLEQITKGTH